MDASVQKALSDKLYDKRKGGALERLILYLEAFGAEHAHHAYNEKLMKEGRRLEGIIRDALAANDHDKIAKIVHQLCHDYAYAVHQPHARNGGLIGLAAAAIALGGEVARYLREIVPPVLACFSDQDARVRYYACESMYNIAKVAKGEVLIYFNDVFDALCKLAADTELSVKNGAELLDRLVKDIVSESAASYVSIYQPDFPADAEGSQDGDMEGVPTAFSLPRFIPLLQERIHVVNPFTRTFLVSWITLLDSIPDLELVVYLPSFLGGLLKFLSDPNGDVHTTTKVALDRFLVEIRKIAGIKKGIAESRKSAGEGARKPSVSSIDGEKSPKSIDGASIKSDEEDTSPETEGEAKEDDAESSASVSTDALDEKNTSAGEEWIPGQDVQVDHAKILDILITFLSESSEEEIQMTTLRWIESFFDICPSDILRFVPRLLSQVLPALSHDVEQVKQSAYRVNQALLEYVKTLAEDRDRVMAPLATQPPAQQAPAPAAGVKSVKGADTNERRESVQSQKNRKPPSPEPPTDAKTGRQETQTPPLQATEKEPSRPPSPIPTPDLDYEAAVNALTLQFLNEHEDTRVAALGWLIMLHRLSPRKILAINDGTFPALLKTLSDPAEAVVTRDLLLLSQISKNSDDSYFSSFMVNLLKLFCTDRRLLETRGNLIIRKLCLNLSAERIYRTLADCLEKEEDLEFASIMVQNLNNNLITAPELADLRKRLRNLETRDGQTFFVALFRSWCHNAVATFSLCLLAQAYEQAYNLLQIFADLEMTVNTLIQIDKLVQLLESPVFTYLRLQLLEPERFPHLYKCLYGLLMLLPQSSAFAALKNRLNSVSAIGYLHIAPRTSAPGTPGTGTGSVGISTFERQNRLRGKEDPGIKWTELLEKFRTVQERARRASLRPQAGSQGMPSGLSLAFPEETVEKERRPGTPSGGLRPGSAASLMAAAGATARVGREEAQTLGHTKGKSSLSHLGRFTSGVGARKGKKGT